MLKVTCVKTIHCTSTSGNFKIKMFKKTHPKLPLLLMVYNGVQLLYFVLYFVLNARCETIISELVIVTVHLKDGILCRDEIQDLNLCH